MNGPLMRPDWTSAAISSAISSQLSSMCGFSTFLRIFSVDCPECLDQCNVCRYLCDHLWLFVGNFAVAGERLAPGLGVFCVQFDHLSNFVNDSCTN